MFSKQLLALTLAVAGSEAVYQGFNYGTLNSDGSSKYESDFKTEFQTAKDLVGTSGFTSARLYTMIQGGTTNDPVQAIPAAIEENTSLLLGIWASAGNMDNELAALKSAIDTYGDALGKLVAGISVGSEDLYRNSATGAKNDAGIGEDPDVLVKYIKEVRSAISGTSLSGASIGHVDTWDAWTNSSNAAVIEELDWLGFDGYPYFQVSMSNGIDNAKALFDDAWQKTVSVSGGRPVWMTETGWPVSGPTMNEAVPSIPNAKQYWDEVACPLLGNTNTWWYTLNDAGSSPSFGVTSGPTDTTPLFDLRCSSSGSGAGAGSAGSSSSSVAPSSAASSSAPAAGTPASSSTPVASSAMGSSAASGFASSTAAASSAPLSSASSTHLSSAISPPLSSAISPPLSSAISTRLSSATSTPSSSGSAAGSGTSAGSGSSSSGASSPSSSPAFNSANRATGSSIFGAVAAILTLAIAV